MVAKIISGKNIRGILHYNENKVDQGSATLILANGFAGEVSTMTVKQKYERFEHLLWMKPSVKTNALHISLNFDPAEKLNDRTLQQIALSYMEKIGFGDQPYLAYRHTDAAHAHVHIATTTINAQGERMDIHNIGKKRSEPARKAIEREFGLVPAGGRRQNPEIRPLRVSEMNYGKTPTKQGITRIVGAVLHSYQFSSLAELNAILRQFNVFADRGQAGSAMYERKGLQYSALDDTGKPVGVPIKASALSGKPTLKALEKRFEKNKVKPKHLKEDLKFRIAGALKGPAPLTTDTFMEKLRERKVDIVFRKNETGFVYGVTFVDHKNRIVFNGSQLGKGFSAKAILERFTSGIERHHPVESGSKKATQGQNVQNQQVEKKLPRPARNRPISSFPTNFPGRIFSEDTMEAPPPVSPRKRKKKRPGQHL